MLHCHVLKIIISLWAATLWADWQVPWDEVLREPRHLGQSDQSLGTRFFVSRNTWGRLIGPLGQGSSWAATLGADWPVPWDEVLREPRHLGQTDRSLGTRFFVSRDTWGGLTSPLGRGSSWAATLGADWRVPWDEVLRELRHLGQTDQSLGTRFFVSRDTWGRLTGPLGRGSSWAATLGADWRVPWDEVLREPRYLGQTDRSLGTRFFVSRDTWGRLTGPLGRGSSWTATLGADWRVPWDEVLREPRHLGQTDGSLGTRFFVSRDTWGRLTGPLGRGSSWAATLGADFLSFFFSFLKTSLGWRNEPRLKKRGSIEKWRLDWKMEARLENGGSIGKWRLDWKMEARLKNGGSIGKWRLDCVIEPRLSQSGKTRYRGRFRSRVFGLVYQKPWVIQNGGSIGKSMLDCVIEPRLSQSGKTRYRGRFRSRVFGLVYQKPWE